MSRGYRRREILEGDVVSPDLSGFEQGGPALPGALRLVDTRGRDEDEAAILAGTLWCLIGLPALASTVSLTNDIVSSSKMAFRSSRLTDMWRYHTVKPNEDERVDSGRPTSRTAEIGHGKMSTALYLISV